MKVINCYRFVKNDLTSENGDLAWKIGEWNQVNGEIICCSNGLHASLTPRDSLKNVYGQKWFVSEANGEIVNKGNKFAASEMRIIREIPMAVLQRFAVWCAVDCLKYYEDKYPNDKKLRECIQAAEKHLGGQTEAEELAKMRAAVSTTTIVGMAASRAVASAVAAALSMLAPNFASWANAAAAASYAAHLAGVASDTAIALVDAQNKANNVETVANAAIIADKAAIAAHRAAAAGAIAHAAAVSAARNTPPPDTPSDVHYSSFAAFTALDTDEYYARQNEKLTELIEQAVSNSQQKYGGTTQ